MTEKQKWHFFNLYCMAVSDGEFTLQEQEAIYRIAQQQGIDPETINNIVTEVGPPAFSPENLEDKITFLYDLTQIAWADNKIDAAEKALMQRFVIKFGFPKENAEEIVAYFLDKVKKGVTTEQIMEELK